MDKRGVVGIVAAVAAVVLWVAVIPAAAAGTTNADARSALKRVASKAGLHTPPLGPDWQSFDETYPLRHPRLSLVHGKRLAPEVCDFKNALRLRPKQRGLEGRSRAINLKGCLAIVETGVPPRSTPRLTGASTKDGQSATSLAPTDGPGGDVYDPAAPPGDGQVDPTEVGVQTSPPGVQDDFLPAPQAGADVSTAGAPTSGDYQCTDLSLDLGGPSGPGSGSGDATCAVVGGKAGFHAHLDWSASSPSECIYENGKEMVHYTLPTQITPDPSTGYAPFSVVMTVITPDGGGYLIPSRDSGSISLDSGQTGDGIVTMRTGGGIDGENDTWCSGDLRRVDAAMSNGHFETTAPTAAAPASQAPAGPAAPAASSRRSAGYFRSWWDDPIGIDVTVAHDTVDFTYSGGCVQTYGTAWSLSWYSPSGWERRKDSHTHGAVCGYAYQSTYARFINDVFCRAAIGPLFGRTTKVYFDRNTIRGLGGNGTLKGLVHSVAKGGCREALSFHYKIYRTV